MNKKVINEAKAKQIAEMLDDPIQRKILYATTWFPFERTSCPIGETEEEWADKKIAQLEIERERLLEEEANDGMDRDSRTLCHNHDIVGHRSTLPSGSSQQVDVEEEL